MQFVLIIYHGTSPLPGSPTWDALPEAERKAIYQQYADLNQDERVTFRLPPLSPTQAKTVQVRDGRPMIKDGPHLTESLGGAFVLDAETLEAALELASRIPQARLGGAVEVRPVEKYF